MTQFRKLIYVIKLPSFLIAFSYFLAQSGCTRSDETHRLSLRTKWEVIIGDNPSFYRSFSKTKWEKIDLYDTLALPVHSVPGFIWYKSSFYLPAKLKKGRQIKIYLGNIGDYDQTFLNGKLVGVNGECVSSPIKFDSTFTDGVVRAFPRSYYCNVDDKSIYWDAKNNIAIRVFNNQPRHNINDNPYLGNINFTDSIYINREAFYLPNKVNELDTVLTIDNRSHQNLNGNIEVSYQIKGSKKRCVCLSQILNLLNGKVISIPVSIPDIKTPVKIFIRSVKDSELLLDDSLTRAYVFK